MCVRMSGGPGAAGQQHRFGQREVVGIGDLEVLRAARHQLGREAQRLDGTGLVGDGLARGVRREFDTEALAGDEGAEILEAVAARDARPARTSIKRSKQLLTIAKAVRAASLAEGRPVSVAEVLGIAA